MRITLHKNFEKRYKKLVASEKEKFKNRRDIFLKDEFDPILNNHPLRGEYQGYRSINVMGDLRAIYKKIGKVAIFVTVGSHSNLYK